MKVINKYLSLILLLIFFTACEKKILTDDVIVNTPIYSVEGTVDGEILSINVGPNNVIAETDLLISNDSFPIFSSFIFNSECLECSEQLTIEIVGDEEWNVTSSVADYLPLGTYPWDWSSDFSIDGEYTLNIESNYDMESFIILDEDGSAVFAGVEIPPTLSLEDGSYSIATNSVSLSGCPVSFNSSITVMDGEICNPGIELFITEDNFSYNAPFEIGPDFILSINGMLTLIPPGTVVSWDDILLPGEALNNIVIVPNDACFSIFSWNFELCSIIDDFSSTVNFTISSDSNQATPLTARLKYIDSSGFLFRSAPLTMGGLEILDIQLSEFESNGEMVFNLLVNIDAELQPEETTLDPIHMIINNALIPISF